MKRVVRSLCMAMWLVAFGCQPPAAMPSFAKYELDGGRYLVDIFNTEGGSSLKFHSTGEGKEATSENYEITWGRRIG